MKYSISTAHIQWLKHQPIKCQCKYGIFVFKLHWPMEQAIVARCAHVLLNTMRLEIWCRKKIEFNQSLYAGFRSGVFFFGISLCTKTKSKENFEKKKRRRKNPNVFYLLHHKTHHPILNNREQSKKWVLNCFVYRWCLAACLCIISIAPVELIILWAQ